MHKSFGKRVVYELLLFDRLYNRCSDEMLTMLTLACRGNVQSSLHSAADSKQWRDLLFQLLKIFRAEKWTLSA